MPEHIIKRDGRKAPYTLDKIAKAIYKAAKSVGGDDYEEAEQLAEKVDARIRKTVIGRDPSVEEVQDIVESVLIDEGHAKTAKAYILYRAERTRVREANVSLMKTFEDLTFKAAIESDTKRENANINTDTAMGTMLKYGSEGAKKFNQLNVLDPKHAKLHANGDIHIHDFDFYMLTTTCCQIDLIRLFRKGFSTGHGNLRSPAGIQSYAALACIAIQSNQNDQHGGQSIPNFDYAMADGVRKTFRREYAKNLAKLIMEHTGIQPKEYRNILRIIKDAQKTAKGQTGLEPRYADEDFGYKDKDGNTTYYWTESEILSNTLFKKYGKKLDNGATPEYLADMAHMYAAVETEDATHQAMEALVHNLNTMNSRAGAQVPFSSINYGTDTSPEGRLAIRNLLIATQEGLGNGETPIFPVQIFKVKSGVNYDPTDPNYDLFKLAMETSAKRMFPNFSFLDAPFNLQYYRPGDYDSEVSYMGCRTRVMGNVYDPSKQTTSGRGNLSFTTINLPRLGIEAHGSLERFYFLLDSRMDDVCGQLMHRYKIIAQKTPRNFPFLMGQGVWMDSETLGIDDPLENILKHGTLSVGFIGLAETLVALVGKHHGEDESAQRLGLEIIGHMRKYLDDISKRLRMNFTLLATPAEGLSGRFVNIDRKRYGEIPGVTDREFYTNSFHVPVYYNISAFRKIKAEAPYHALTNAGHISYIELDGDPSKNLDAFEGIVRCMHDSGIGYGAINHPIDRDPCCGFDGIIDDTCPSCGRKEHYTISERIKRPKI